MTLPKLAAGQSPTVIIRAAADVWRATQDDRIVGEGHAVERPDGRTSVCIDAWHHTAFEQIAVAMLLALPGAVLTLVDESDSDALTTWIRAGLRAHRQTYQYAIATERPRDASSTPPEHVTLLPSRALDDARLSMQDLLPSEVGGGRPRPERSHEDPCLPSQAETYPNGSVVALARGEFIGFARTGLVSRRTRETRAGRIEQIAVRADWRGRGVGRALLSSSLERLSGANVVTAFADVAAADTAAVALFEHLGANRVGALVEMVRDGE